MQITWLGHSGFRIEIEDAVLLVDPWLTGNPMFPAGREDEAVTGATHILLTHGHGDHIAGVHGQNPVAFLFPLGLDHRGDPGESAQDFDPTAFGDDPMGEDGRMEIAGKQKDQIALALDGRRSPGGRSSRA